MQEFEESLEHRVAMAVRALARATTEIEELSRDGGTAKYVRRDWSDIQDCHHRLSKVLGWIVPAIKEVA